MALTLCPQHKRPQTRNVSTGAFRTRAPIVIKMALLFSSSRSGKWSLSPFCSNAAHILSSQSFRSSVCTCTKARASHGSPLVQNDRPASFSYTYEVHGIKNARSYCHRRLKLSSNPITTVQRAAKSCFNLNLI